ncbi:MAG TPA: bicyclomycin resistance protein, partial [Burkholderiaceae bacterium]|nr:bicyclomycin resistance protein [Burkholderiaceae bacterium]
MTAPTDRLDTTRRALIGAGLGGALGAALPATTAAPVTPAKKVLRYAFEVAETSLDPVKLNDLYSRILTAHLFEALYTYDHL